MKKNKIFLVIFILIFCFLATSWIAWVGFKYYQKKDNKLLENNRANTIETRIDTEKVLSQDIYNNLKSQKEKVDENLRQEFIDFTEKNFSDLVPFPSENSISFEIIRFAFISNANLYAEYKDEQNSSKILLNCIKNKEKVICNRIAFFVPNRFLWEISEGNDYFNNQVSQYYEKNKATNNWEKVGTSDLLIFFPVNNLDLVEMQNSTNLGDNIWRLNPLEVVKMDMPKDMNFDVTKDRYTLISQNGGEAEVEIVHSKSEFKVSLEQPIKKGEEGIWIMKKMIRIE